MLCRDVSGSGDHVRDALRLVLTRSVPEKAASEHSPYSKKMRKKHQAWSSGKCKGPGVRAGSTLGSRENELAHCLGLECMGSLVRPMNVT